MAGTKALQIKGKVIGDSTLGWEGSKDWVAKNKNEDKKQKEIKLGYT